MKDVSFLIPARNEIYLEKTVRNILENMRGDSEVLVYLDGWLPEPPIHFDDERVKVFHFPESKGHRRATNYLSKQAEGRFICKIDAHCAIDEGFDVKMADECHYDYTLLGRMYNLDYKTFQPKLIHDFTHAVRMGKLHDYIYMGINDKDELRVLYYPHEINKKMHHERKDILIDETMACMGPSFFMHKERFWELGGCDEDMGMWGQQGVELACKAWLSGGKLMTNKKTWYAHWFRAGDGGFPYHISGNAIDRSRAYSKDYWMNNRWPLAKHKFQWLIDKFDPPNRDRIDAYYGALNAHQAQ